MTQLNIYFLLFALSGDKKGKCFSCEENSTSCAMMGLKTNANNNLVPGFKYYFTTGKESPFCSKLATVTE